MAPQAPVALFDEQLPGHLDAKLILVMHDELVVECPEEQAEEVARFVEEVMAAGMDEVSITAVAGSLHIARQSDVQR